MSKVKYLIVAGVKIFHAGTAILWDCVTIVEIYGNSRYLFHSRTSLSLGISPQPQLFHDILFLARLLFLYINEISELNRQGHFNSQEVLSWLM